MAVNRLEGLVANLDGGLPAPDVLNVLAGSRVGVVDLLEVVALPVGGNIESGSVLLATDKEDTTDDTVVVGTEDGLATEEVLAGSLQTGVETTDQVVGHEGELQLVIVLVVDLPERVLLGVVVLPEPLHSGRGVLVGVGTLPLIDGELGLAESLERVLGLGSLRGGLGGLSSGGRLGLLLLLGGSVLDDLLSEDGVGNDSLEGVLVDNGVVPPGDGGVGLAPGLVQNGSEGTGQESGSEDISQGDTLTNQVGVGSEVGLESTNGLQGDLGDLIGGLLVVGLKAEEGAVPGTETGQKLTVGEGEPADDGSIVLLGLTKEGSLLVLGGDCKATIY